ncbi:AEC family transporter [Sulfitobacter donghicola]|uniref:Malate transporter n=1 Tax=Sulfitobacter donghicola DSW-25 = KCTC 12864 = JCM 14565 TaxID=1300350 RepID=A0A073ILL5_9RHOB|nr:AEC family transporter [Sulfitobacter donghicola]KEJ90465.1 malate transporter [Sulfitobacter donghicola DSW-25 = KCTC 12864 = JCM 14565]KIN67702.1 Auxin Efflux Carrier [Sulfitobacter donghicola DSW-25 = KCTC 12864 = JCM 14565]
MLAIFLKTLPFFAIIGLGYLAGRTRFFTAEATAYLTKFVFYFALSAMLFRFAANLSLAEVWDTRLVVAYLWGTAFAYGIATLIGFYRNQSIEVTAMEAQCAVIGNVGFLGVPMLTLLLGPEAIGPVMLALAVDLIVFSSLIVILITGSRDGRMSIAVLRTVGLGLLKNPMIVAMALGLVWSSLSIPIPTPMNEFLALLGAAATPGALFAIGASLASKSAERLTVAGWLSFSKLVVHPLLVAIACFVFFKVDPYKASVVISAAALPVAGNVYILAQHYGVAPQRASAAILISTAFSIVTVSMWIAWLSTP